MEKTFDTDLAKSRAFNKTKRENKALKKKNKMLTGVIIASLAIEGFVVGYMYATILEQDQKIDIILESSDVPEKFKKDLEKTFKK